MLSLFRELKAAGNNLSDEQQVQTGIRSLSDTWGVWETHNENNKTFDDLCVIWSLKLSTWKRLRLMGHLILLNLVPASLMGRSATDFLATKLRRLRKALRK